MADRAPPFLSDAPQALTRLLVIGPAILDPFGSFWGASPARMSQVTIATISPPNGRDSTARPVEALHQA
jgi:hypothetical protein